MKTFYGADGNYAEIPLSDILDRMTDDWIDSEVTGANISELRDACRKLQKTAHNSEYAKCKVCSKERKPINWKYCPECGRQLIKMSNENPELEKIELVIEEVIN